MAGIHAETGAGCIAAGDGAETGGPYDEGVAGVGGAARRVRSAAVGGLRRRYQAVVGIGDDAGALAVGAHGEDADGVWNYVDGDSRPGLAVVRNRKCPLSDRRVRRHESCELAGGRVVHQRRNGRTVDGHGDGCPAERGVLERGGSDGELLRAKIDALHYEDGALGDAAARVDGDVAGGVGRGETNPAGADGQLRGVSGEPSRR